MLSRVKERERGWGGGGEFVQTSRQQATCCIDDPDREMGPAGWVGGYHQRYTVPRYEFLVIGCMYAPGAIPPRWNTLLYMPCFNTSFPWLQGWREG